MAFISFEEATKILREELNFPQERALHYIRKFDKNQDGKLSKQEFEDFRAKIDETKNSLVPEFKKYDQDGNGYITLDEARGILQNPPFSFTARKVVLLLKKWDMDGNGKLDIEEFANFLSEAKTLRDEIATEFDKLDKDGNGVLSPDEVQTVIMDALGLDVKAAQVLVDMFDSNKDGNLDKTEFMSLWSTMFA